jgi:ketosteroid isomerase-like protein
VTLGDRDVEHVTRMLRDTGRRFEGSGELESYFAEFFCPDAVMEHVDDFPLPGSYEGLEGYRRWFDDAYGPYEDVAFRVESVAAEGDRVLALMTITGRERGDKVELTVQMGNTYEMRDGRIARVRVYVGHERAIEAARSGG